MYKPGPYPESLVFDIDNINLYVIVDNDPVLSTMQWVENISRCMKFFDQLFMHTGHWHIRNNDPHIADLIPVEKGGRRFANGTIISWLHRKYFFTEELDAHTEYLESLGINGPEYPTWD